MSDQPTPSGDPIRDLYFATKAANDTKFQRYTDHLLGTPTSPNDPTTEGE